MARSSEAQIARLERCITNAERQVEAQEASLRHAALEGRNTAVDEFELQKMRLLLAILHEGRERVAQQAHRGQPGSASAVPPSANVLVTVVRPQGSH